MENSTNKNISFTLEEHGQEFDFMWTGEDGLNINSKAYLQLPQTPDSQESIFLGDKKLDVESDLFAKIYNELREYFYSQFKDEHCAKASARLGKRIHHVEQVNNYYIALDEHQNWYVLEEGRASSYYNVFYFEIAAADLDSDFDPFIELAQYATVYKIVEKIKESNQEYGSNMADDSDNGRIQSILSGYGLEDDVKELEDAFGEIYQKIREAEQGSY